MPITSSPAIRFRRLESSPELNTALASLKQGGVSPAVTVPVNKLAVALVTSLTPAHPATLDEVRPQVEAAVRHQKVDEWSPSVSTISLAKTKADGNDLAKAASELGSGSKRVHGLRPAGRSGRFWVSVQL